MFKWFVIFLFALIVSASISYGFIDHKIHPKFLSYNTGKTVDIDFSNATIIKASEEDPEIVKKLENLEDELNDGDWGKSVWMVCVPTISQGSYRSPPGVQFSFGSCVAISSLDPAFKMTEYDMDEMKNNGIAKKNYDINSTYMDTNFHVIDGWNKKNNLPIEIKKIFITNNGERKIISYLAEIVGTVPWEDYAVLKIKKVKIPHLPIGDLSMVSDFQKKNGYPVMAIGSPYVFEGVRSEGKVFYPEINLGNNFYELFGAIADVPLNEKRYHTNADINPGNSGGALIGMTGENKGKIIGKPCSGYPDGNLNFAIPDRILKELFPLVLTGKINTPCYSGLMMVSPKTALKDPVNIAFFEKLGLKNWNFEIEKMNGALVVGFMDNSPLKTPIKNYFSISSKNSETDPNMTHYGDVIIAVNDEQIEDPSDFLKKLKAVKKEKVEIKVIRFVNRIEDDKEIQEKQEIIISKTRKEITLTNDEYSELYQEIEKNGFSALFQNAEMRGM